MVWCDLGILCFYCHTLIKYLFFFSFLSSSDFLLPCFVHFSSKNTHLPYKTFRGLVFIINWIDSPPPNFSSLLPKTGHCIFLNLFLSHGRVLEGEKGRYRARKKNHWDGGGGGGEEGEGEGEGIGRESTRGTVYGDICMGVCGKWEVRWALKSKTSRLVQSGLSGTLTPSFSFPLTLSLPQFSPLFFSLFRCPSPPPFLCSRR